MSNWHTHLKHLEDQHRTLDKTIDGMEKTGRFIDEDLQYLKKKRLQLKDEIAILKRQHNELE